MRVKEKTMLEIMRVKRLTRSGLAALIGTGYSMVIHVLKGRRKFSIRHTKILLKFFGIELLSRAIDWEGINASCFSK
jgi:antitoxin component HigA of HigAB toxin-antitoxin module